MRQWLTAPDEEVKAVDLMCSCLVANPLHYGFLVTQAQFLLKKNRPDLAIELAKAAVNANPSEYATWAILTESYIAINEYENVPPPKKKKIQHVAGLLTLGTSDIEFMSHVHLPRQR